MLSPVSSSMIKGRTPRRHRLRRMWFILMLFLLISMPLFLLGIDTVELALLVLIYYYLLWCTKRE